MRNTHAGRSSIDSDPPSTGPPWRRALGLGLLAGALLVVLLAGTAAVSEPADALPRFFPINNGTAIDDTATLSPSGSSVLVTGHITCTAVESVEIRVRVTQESTGAVAEGTYHGRCGGETSTWSAKASTGGGAAFEETVRRGKNHKATEARVEAWATTRHEGELGETVNWDNDRVTLVEG